MGWLLVSPSHRTGMVTRGLNDAAVPLVVSGSDQPTPKDFSLRSAISEERWPGEVEVAWMGPGWVGREERQSPRRGGEGRNWEVRQQTLLGLPDLLFYPFNRPCRGLGPCPGPRLPSPMVGSNCRDVGSGWEAPRPFFYLFLLLSPFLLGRLRPSL